MSPVRLARPGSLAGDPDTICMSLVLQPRSSGFSADGRFFCGGAFSRLGFRLPCQRRVRRGRMAFALERLGDGFGALYTWPLAAPNAPGVRNLGGPCPLR